MRLLLAVGVVGTVGMIGTIDAHADDPKSVIASASTATADHLLGRPFSDAFEPLVGADGKSIFPSAKIIKHASTGEMGVDWIEINNSSELAANAHGWGGIVQGEVAAKSGKRYLAYRAYQLTSIVELDDTVTIAEAPPGATYYLSKIFYGRSYEVVVAGDYATLSAGVKASFVGFGGEVSAFESKFGVKSSARLRGLKPKLKALLDGKNVTEHYGEDHDFGKPMPIKVEFRLIPGRSIPRSVQYDWRPDSGDGRITHLVVELSGAKKDWTSTGVKIALDDFVSVRVAEKVKVGDWIGYVGPTGNNGGPGRLDMMIGERVSAIGGGTSRIANEADVGELRFRVYDTKYEDNDGAFILDIVVVPAAVLPECRHAASNRAAYKRKRRCR